MARKLWVTANVLMLLMFLMSVAVQYNDPDPLTWMTIYGLAAVACVMELSGRTRWWMPALIGAGALVWAVTIEPRVLGKVPFLSMFSAWEMKNAGIEESREMYGLVIVTVWMAALAIHARRSVKRA